MLSNSFEFDILFLLKYSNNIFIKIRNIVVILIDFNASTVNIESLERKTNILYFLAIQIIKTAHCGLS